MEDNINEKDINDVFDSIAFSEEKISCEAFNEGLAKGREDGKIDGYHLGFHRGLELGTEIGFYKGLAKTLLSNFETLNVKNSEKVYGLILKLNNLLCNFPTKNIENVDVMLEIDNIRACYRQINSLLKLNLSFPVSSVMSF